MLWCSFFVMAIKHLKRLHLAWKRSVQGICLDCQNNQHNWNLWVNIWPCEHSHCHVNTSFIILWISHTFSCEYTIHYLVKTPNIFLWTHYTLWKYHTLSSKQKLHKLVNNPDFLWINSTISCEQTIHCNVKTVIQNWYVKKHYEDKNTIQMAPNTIMKR